MGKMKNSYNVADGIRQLDPKTVMDIAKISGGDGHTIFNVQAYVDAGMPPEMIAVFQRTYESDGSAKGSITAPDGTPLATLRGVYGLTVVESIADALGLPTGSHMGRGFRASAAYAAIERWFIDKTIPPNKQ